MLPPATAHARLRLTHEAPPPAAFDSRGPYWCWVPARRAAAGRAQRPDRAQQRTSPSIPQPRTGLHLRPSALLPQREQQGHGHLLPIPQL